MAKKIPSTDEQIARLPLRPHVSPEWLTKLSSSEFWNWCDTQADIIRFRGGTSKVAIQLHLEDEIKNQERMYQLLKDIKTRDNDIKLGGELTGITANTLTYGQNYVTATARIKDVNTYDIETLPSNKEAVLTQTGTRNMNGRIYPEYTLSNMIRRDKYAPVEDYKKQLFK